MDGEEIETKVARKTAHAATKNGAFIAASFVELSARALFYEASFRGAGKRLAVLTDGAVFTAFVQEAGLRSARERPTVLPDSLRCACHVLRHRRAAPDDQSEHRDQQYGALHEITSSRPLSVKSYAADTTVTSVARLTPVT
jgi:hypothetical protein